MWKRLCSVMFWLVHYRSLPVMGRCIALTNILRYARDVLDCLVKFLLSLVCLITRILLALHTNTACDSVVWYWVAVIFRNVWIKRMYQVCGSVRVRRNDEEKSINHQLEWYGRNITNWTNDVKKGWKGYYSMCARESLRHRRRVTWSGLQDHRHFVYVC